GRLAGSGERYPGWLRSNTRGGRAKSDPQDSGRMGGGGNAMLMFGLFVFVLLFELSIIVTFVRLFEPLLLLLPLSGPTFVVVLPLLVPVLRLLLLLPLLSPLLPLLVPVLRLLLLPLLLPVLPLLLPV